MYIIICTAASVGFSATRFGTNGDIYRIMRSEGSACKRRSVETRNTNSDITSLDTTDLRVLDASPSATDSVDILTSISSLAILKHNGYQLSLDSTEGGSISTLDEPQTR